MLLSQNARLTFDACDVTIDFKFSTAPICRGSQFVEKFTVECCDIHDDSLGVTSDLTSD